MRAGDRRLAILARPVEAVTGQAWYEQLVAAMAQFGSLVRALPPDEMRLTLVPKRVFGELVGLDVPELLIMHRAIVLLRGAMGPQTVVPNIGMGYVLNAVNSLNVPVHDQDGQFERERQAVVGAARTKVASIALEPLRNPSVRVAQVSVDASVGDRSRIEDVLRSLTPPEYLRLGQLTLTVFGSGSPEGLTTDDLMVQMQAAGIALPEAD